MAVESKLLSGNEAVAQGAWEAGCLIGAGYPGTPSTEALEAFAKYDDVYAEWAPNEKVAFEVASGASMGGVRAMVTMKHVGVNVAADPLYSMSYIGVNGGLVLFAADDPGIFSSQNEQDSRFHALGARVPLLEPADPAEAKFYVKQAFAISERFDTPVIVRSTVRLSHTKAVVECEDRADQPRKEYEKNPVKWVMMPANAKVRRKFVDARVAELAEFNNASVFVRADYRDTNIGVICAGVTYNHVREALPEASVLKLGMTYPIPDQAILDFASRVDKVYVVEEASNYLSMQVKALGVELSEFVEPIPPDDELSPGIVRRAFGIETPEFDRFDGALPPRPPALCAGCPHRLVYSELRRMNAVVNGDIGCYTLGALAPLSSVDSVVDMGASLSMAHGMELARQFSDKSIAIDGRPIVGVIGDSTFAHSGITSLLGTVYNQGSGTLCILDNRTTAMTGMQGNPVNGITLQNRPSRELDLVKLCEALGVEDVQRVDSQNLADVRAALKRAVASDGLSVIVFCSPCRLLVRTRKEPPTISDCKRCGACLKIGCPALGTDDEGHAKIDETQCIGCGQCAQVCPFGCISSEGRE
ncbi:MAG: 4Fe-4S binding protein [Coriobacteriales bacterium]|nr:4Fe-4S binding protein [Coriobacteriales bacterium]